MIDSNNMTVDACSFPKSAGKITVKGVLKEGKEVKGFSLWSKDVPHPDMQKERLKLAKIVEKILEFDIPTQERCIVDKISANWKTGEFDIEISIQLPGYAKAPKIQVKKFNDITRRDVEHLMLEAAMYIAGEKTAQSTLEFA